MRKPRLRKGQEPPQYHPVGKRWVFHPHGLLALRLRVPLRGDHFSSFWGECMEVPPGSVGLMITFERPRRGSARQTDPEAGPGSRGACFPCWQYSQVAVQLPWRHMFSPGSWNPCSEAGLPGSCWLRPPCPKGFAHLSPPTSWAEGKLQETGRMP